MAGLALSTEETAAQIRALIDERDGYARRAQTISDDKERERLERQVEEVEEQLRLRGHKATAPQQRASKRVREAAETR